MRHLMKLHRDTKGFTLIELMIVIAIIGILAAIAIPNFIAYRNKTYCSMAESDANTVAAAISDYFAIPTNTTVSNASLPNLALSNGNTFTITSADPSVSITITVTDASLRCPLDYQNGKLVANSPSEFWNAVAGGGVYTKVLNP